MTNIRYAFTTLVGKVLGNLRQSMQCLVVFANSYWTQVPGWCGVVTLTLCSLFDVDVVISPWHCSARGTMLQNQIRADICFFYPLEPKLTIAVKD